MRIFTKLLVLFTLAIILTGCGSTQKITQIETIQNAWESGDTQQSYDLSVAAVSKLEDKGKDVPVDLLEWAGKSALALNKFGEARQYLEKAMNKSPETESLYPLLVRVYKEIDNLSYEITTLENYKERFPEGRFIEELNSKAFIAYVNSENWQFAKNTWIELDSTEHVKPENLEMYILVLEQLNSKAELDEIATTLLKIEPKNAKALTYKAIQIYTTAEERYSTEMAAYNAKKTRKQYTKLLEALKQSTEEFKKARDMFETVYAQTEDKEIAGYLANIYARLNNKSKADFYKKRSL